MEEAKPHIHDAHGNLGLDAGADQTWLAEVFEGMKSLVLDGLMSFVVMVKRTRTHNNRGD
jgi:hypothetical protein